MKNKLKIAAVLLGLCLMLIPVFLKSHSQTKQRYEYKFVNNAKEKDANSLASEGWELVAVDSGQAGLSKNPAVYIFRREK